MYFPFITIPFCFVNGVNLLGGCFLSGGGSYFPLVIPWHGVGPMMASVSVTQIGIGGFECKLALLGCKQDGAGSAWAEMEWMQPSHPSARQAFFGASDPKSRRQLRSPQVYELPNSLSLYWLTSCWCKTCGVCGRWRNECESSKISHLSGDLTKVWVWGFFSSKYRRVFPALLSWTCLRGCVQADLCLPSLHLKLLGSRPDLGSHVATLAQGSAQVDGSASWKGLELCWCTS